MEQYAELVRKLSPGWDGKQDQSTSSDQQAPKHKAEQPMGPVFSSMAMPLEQDSYTCSTSQVRRLAKECGCPQLIVVLNLRSCWECRTLVPLP